MFWKVREVLPALEYCDDDLFEDLELWGGSVGTQLGYLNGQEKILWMPGA
jgi:hypothetical protein